MTYTVTIASADGNKHTFRCGGVFDQQALIYASKIVEEKADEADPSTLVLIFRNG